MSFDNTIGHLRAQLTDGATRRRRTEHRRRVAALSTAALAVIVTAGALTLAPDDDRESIHQSIGPPESNTSGAAATSVPTGIGPTVPGVRSPELETRTTVTDADGNEYTVTDAPSLIRTARPDGTPANDRDLTFEGPGFRNTLTVREECNGADASMGGVGTVDPSTGRTNVLYIFPPGAHTVELDLGDGTTKSIPTIGAATLHRPFLYLRDLETLPTIRNVLNADGVPVQSRPCPR